MSDWNLAGCSHLYGARSWPGKPRCASDVFESQLDSQGFGCQRVLVSPAEESRSGKSTRWEEGDSAWVMY